VEGLRGEEREVFWEIVVGSRLSAVGCGFQENFKYLSFRTPARRGEKSAVKNADSSDLKVLGMTLLFVLVGLRPFSLRADS
jgi:hypothetical protein